jgi:hypothetical protein
MVPFEEPEAAKLLDGNSAVMTVLGNWKMTFLVGLEVDIYNFNVLSVLGC